MPGQNTSSVIISELMNESPELSKLENLFLALADQTRLRLLNLMRKDEICVGLLAQVLDESQPKISRHLAFLRGSGLVSARRQGKQIYYSLNFSSETPVTGILEDILSRFDEQENLQREYRRLVEVLESTEESFESVFEIAPDISAQAHIKQRRAELETFLL